MKLVCISDTHGDHEQVWLPPGDVLIHAGDLTAHGRCTETLEFMRWFGGQRFEHKLCIAGNHDTFMEAEPEQALGFAQECGVVLLNDSGCRIGGVSFWGSPITPRFFDWSFMRDPGASIQAHWDLIPQDTDVLITHGPPQGILDEVQRTEHEVENTGCPSLLQRVRHIRPQLHLFGHIHEAYGCQRVDNLSCFNVSTMDKVYRIANAPVVIELPINQSGDIE